MPYNMILRYNKKPLLKRWNRIEEKNNLWSIVDVTSEDRKQKSIQWIVFK